MSGLEEASREELLALVVEQARVIEQFTGRVAELERRLARNSQNSSQPPSADGPQVAPRRSRRKGSGRKPGRQPGSPGNTLALVDDPDEVIEHQPDCCRGCGADLADGAPLGVVRRQVHDIPPVRPLIVEHRLHRRRCGCGAVTVADAPAGVAGPVQYGPSTCWTRAFFGRPMVRRDEALRPDPGGVRVVRGPPVGRLGQHRAGYRDLGHQLAVLRRSSFGHPQACPVLR